MNKTKNIDTKKIKLVLLVKIGKEVRQVVISKKESPKIIDLVTYLSGGKLLVSENTLEGVDF